VHPWWIRHDRRRGLSPTSGGGLTPVYADAVQKVIDELGRLPGIGPKSAQRLAFHILKSPTEDATRLAEAISEMKERIRFCERCFNISEEPLCLICSDARREAGMLCVVEEPRDIVALERTGGFRGRYHVLGGAISPIDGIGPDQLRVAELLGRMDEESVTEVILATNPNIEGEATAMYLARLIGPLGVEVTRIASGLPVGGDLEYADELTLGRALEGRRHLAGGPDEGNGHR
jgi:recombination protein RecR